MERKHTQYSCGENPKIESTDRKEQKYEIDRYNSEKDPTSNNKRKKIILSYIFVKSILNILDFWHNYI